MPKCAEILDIRSEIGHGLRARFVDEAKWMKIWRGESELNMNKFREEIFKIVSRILKGRTMTYKEVAKLAGRPMAYRAVGSILNKNYDPGIPCHRVILSGGKTGGYNRGVKRKIELLKKEGIMI